MSFATSQLDAMLQSRRAFQACVRVFDLITKGALSRGTSLAKPASLHRIEHGIKVLVGGRALRPSDIGCSSSGCRSPRVRRPQSSDQPCGRRLCAPCNGLRRGSPNLSHDLSISVHHGFKAQDTFAAVWIVSFNVLNSCSDTRSYSVWSAPSKLISFHDPIPPNTHADWQASNKLVARSETAPFGIRSLW